MWQYQINAAVLAMRRKAEELGVTGVGFIMIQLNGTPWVTTGFSIEPLFPEIGEGATYNVVGIAWMKAAYSMRTGKPSGGDAHLREGESPYRGCLVRDFRDLEGYGKILLFFSGGTEDQDVAIAHAGEEIFPIL